MKILALDLDGTLLNSVHDVSRYSHNVLKQLKDLGLIIGLCSGRDVEQVRRLLSVWNLEGIPSFIIGNNGADYYSLVSGLYSSSNYLNYQDLTDLSRELRKYKVTIGVQYENKMYWNAKTVWSLGFSIANHKKPVFGQMSSLKEATFPKIYILGAKGVIKSINRRAGRLDEMLHLKMIPTGSRLIEVTHPDVSKYEGLKRAMREFSVTEKEILSFGDDYNDLEMLRFTNGVAMKNAPEIVKEAARSVTKYANSQDGLAYHLNSLLMSSPYMFQDPPAEDPNARPPEEELLNDTIEFRAYDH